MNIALVGFMGSGKSTVAVALAKVLGWSAIDMDILALRSSQRDSITEIFREDGEKEFRRLEETTAASLTTKNHQVVATGGGVVMSEKTMQSLKKNAVIVFLKASFPVIEKRLRGVTDRPLWNDKQKARDLFIERVPLYEKYADITVSTDDQSPSVIIEKIVLHAGGIL